MNIPDYYSQLRAPDYFDRITNDDIKWVKQHYKMPLSRAQIGALAARHCAERERASIERVRAVKALRKKQKQEELEKNPIYKYYKDYDKYDKEAD